MTPRDWPAAEGVDPAPDTIRRMVEALAPRIPGVAERTASRARAEIPAYATLPEEELREGVMRDLGLAVQALVDERGFTDGEREILGTIGDTRAQQGLPLESMLRVYRITVDEIFGELWSAVEAGEFEPSEVMQLTRRVWAYAGPAMDIATTAYRHRELELALADSERRTGLVHELLLSASSAPHAAAAALGLDPLREYVAFRARPGNGEPGALMSALKLPGVLDGGAAAPYEGDVIGLALRRPGIVPDPGTVIGLGPPAGLAALPASFVVASRTVETAAAFGLDGAVELGDLPLHAVALAEGEVGELLHARCIEPVLAERGGGAEVLDTVRAFLSHDLGAEAAADALGVHPNTIRNRLHRYESLTGVSLRAIDDLVQLRLALLHADLAARDRDPG